MCPVNPCLALRWLRYQMILKNLRWELSDSHCQNCCSILAMQIFIKWDWWRHCTQALITYQKVRGKEDTYTSQLIINLENYFLRNATIDGKECCVDRRKFPISWLSRQNVGINL